VLALTFPSGSPILTTRQTKTMTVGADTVDLAVPTGKRWIVYRIWARNESTKNIVMTVNIRDASNIIGNLFTGTVNDDVNLNLPMVEGTNDPTVLGHGGWPLVMEAAQRIRITWGALAAKADNGYYYVEGLQF
jgi:hypothetical protein